MSYFHLETRESNVKAYEHFRRSAELDPEFASAFGYAAAALLIRRIQGWAESPEEEVRRCIECARRAAELGAHDSIALAHSSVCLIHNGDENDFQIGGILAEQALSINRSSMWAWYTRGLFRIGLGDFDSAISALQLAARLSPMDSALYMIQTGLACALMLAGRLEEALQAISRPLWTHPGWLPALRVKAATLSLMGRMDEGRLVVDEVLALDPSVRLANLPARILRLREVDRQRYVGALERVGLPQ
jgi:tetratricopeptide (TPR) repeat protein